jgi:hypothetical protein
MNQRSMKHLARPTEADQTNVQWIRHAAILKRTEQS